MYHFCSYVFIISQKYQFFTTASKTIIAKTKIRPQRLIPTERYGLSIA